MSIQDQTSQPAPFSTTSLDLSAYLLSLGIELLGSNPLPGGRLAFVFPAESEELVASYFEGELVSAIRFWGELKRLKSLVHSKVQHGG